MASFIRSKQAGIQNDLSAGLTPEHVAIDDIDRYGINSQIGSIAYDPVQSLLAVGTSLDLDKSTSSAEAESQSPLIYPKEHRPSRYNSVPTS
jgi:hypothetical protein